MSDIRKCFSEYGYPDVNASLRLKASILHLFLKNARILKTCFDPFYYAFIHSPNT